MLHMHPDAPCAHGNWTDLHNVCRVWWVVAFWHVQCIETGYFVMCGAVCSSKQFSTMLLFLFFPSWLAGQRCNISTKRNTCGTIFNSDCLEKSKVVFLPKPGKETYDLPKSFRPICLMSFMLKTLERLCDRHIRGTTLALCPLYKLQHAYMTGRSVESALHWQSDKVSVPIISATFNQFGVTRDIGQSACCWTDLFCKNSKNI